MRSKILGAVTMTICLATAPSVYPLGGDCDEEYLALMNADFYLETAQDYRDSVCPELPVQCGDANTIVGERQFEVWDAEDAMDQCIMNL